MAGVNSDHPGGDHPQRTIRQTIPSDFAKARDIQTEILDAAESSGFKGQNLFAIKLSLEEAVINAIKHGNKLNPHKSVEILAEITPERTVIEIEDQGAGFNRKDVPDPTLEENLDKCSGRGILLIEAYMNSVEWSNQGRRLRMVKTNDPEPMD